MFKFRNYNFKSFSLALVTIVLALGGIGVSLIQRLQDSDEQQFEKQVIAYAIGIVIMLFMTIVDYHFIAKFAIPLYLINLGLLLFTRYTSSANPLSIGPLKIYGKKHYTAKRWIEIAKGKSKLEFMPSELTKIIMIICLAVLLDKLQKQIKKFWVILLAGLLMAIPIFIVLIQPDLSTSIVMFLFFCILMYDSGISYKYIIPIILVGIPLVFFLIWYVQQDWQGLLNEYQQNRVLSLINPAEHTAEMYQQNNAMLAIQSGGLFGKLFTGDTSQRLTDYVPVVESDFIFSAIGEEFGIFGMVIIIGAYCLFAILGIRIAMRAKDVLGRLMAVGITSLLTIQAFVNMGVVTSLLPNTGIPLPFVSSGLSALLSNLFTLGILLNISIQPAGYTSSEGNDYDFKLKARGSQPNDFSKISL